MDRETHNQLHIFLLPFMRDERERRALIDGALFGTQVINQIDWQGDAETFTNTLLTQLVRYGDLPDGRSAIVVLLEYLRERVGINRQAEINRLIQKLGTSNHQDVQEKKQSIVVNLEETEHPRIKSAKKERSNVFVSSTSRDLETYREAVTNTVLRLGMYPIIMETFNPTANNALQLCYDKIQEADIFVGIYAHRYGYAPTKEVTYTLTDGTICQGDGHTSITELEYEWARSRAIPMLLFVVSESDSSGGTLAWSASYIDDEPNKSRLTAFKNRVMKRHVVGFFHSPNHLAMQVATGLLDLVKSDNAVTSQTSKVKSDISASPFQQFTVNTETFQRDEELSSDNRFLGIRFFPGIGLLAAITNMICVSFALLFISLLSRNIFGDSPNWLQFTVIALLLILANLITVWIPSIFLSLRQRHILHIYFLSGVIGIIYILFITLSSAEQTQLWEGNDQSSLTFTDIYWFPILFCCLTPAFSGWLLGQLIGNSLIIKEEQNV